MTAKEHLALHDKQIRAIRDLVKEGIRLVITSRQDTRREIKELIAAQKRTDAKVEALADNIKALTGSLQI